MDKDTFLAKVKDAYKFTESIKDSAMASNQDQVAKLCERLMDEMKLTFDAVVESMFGKLVLKLANEDDHSRVKKVDKGVTADYRDILKQDPEQTEFLEGVKGFAKSQLKDWPKAEFKLHQFFEFFDGLKLPLYKASFDAEKQKLTKTYVDLLQKQFIFDEVLKIIEEENIDIENLFLAAFERLGEAAQKEEESMVSNSKEELSEMTESRKGSDDASNYSDQLLVNIHSSKNLDKPVDDKLKLNFNNIKEVVLY